MKVNQEQFNALSAKGLMPNQHKLTGFAEACFDWNNPESLMDFDTAEADQTDIESWNIDEQEWRYSQKQALEAAMADFIEQNED